MHKMGLSHHFNLISVHLAMEKNEPSVVERNYNAQINAIPVDMKRLLKCS